jgi:hypothetical protein
VIRVGDLSAETLKATASASSRPVRRGTRIHRRGRMGHGVIHPRMPPEGRIVQIRNSSDWRDALPSSCPSPQPRPCPAMPRDAPAAVPRVSRGRARRCGW